VARWAQKPRDALVLEERRRKGLGFLRQGVRPAEVARRLAVTPQAVHQWRETLEANGPHALRAKPRGGRPPFVERETRATLPEVLARGAPSFGSQTDLWTRGRIVDGLEKEGGVRSTQSGAGVLLKRNGFSGQRPSRQAREKDRAQVARWARSTWPRLKKEPANNGR
jgi:transposase